MTQFKNEVPESRVPNTSNSPDVTQEMKQAEEDLKKSDEAKSIKRELGDSKKSEKKESLEDIVADPEGAMGHMKTPAA